MASGKAASALVGLAVLAGAMVAQAHPPAGSEAEIAARERATVCSLLEALMKRRADIAASEGDAAVRDRMLDTLDRRIAELRMRVGSDGAARPQPDGG